MALVLASTSFRRQELLSWLGIPFEIVAPDFDEAAVNVADFPSATEYCKVLALGKLLSVLEQRPIGDVVIAADTIVVLNGRVFGKPRDQDHAREMLQMLSGCHHTIVTGVAIVRVGESAPQVFVEESLIQFHQLSDTIIEQYLSTSEPLGKAGAYAIQGQGQELVASFTGEVTAIIGLPLLSLQKRLVDFGVQSTVDVQQIIDQHLGELCQKRQD